MMNATDIEKTEICVIAEISVEDRNKQNYRTIGILYDVQNLLKADLLMSPALVQYYLAEQFEHLEILSVQLSDLDQYAVFYTARGEENGLIFVNVSLHFEKRSRIAKHFPEINDSTPFPPHMRLY